MLTSIVLRTNSEVLYFGQSSPALKIVFELQQQIQSTPVQVFQAIVNYHAEHPLFHFQQSLLQLPQFEENFADFLLFPELAESVVFPEFA